MVVRQFAHKMLATLGFQLVRVSPTREPKGADKYFNTGTLTPHEENSLDLYNRFYSDDEALDIYYSDGRLAFYRSVSEYVRNAGLVLDGRQVIDVGCGAGFLLEELASWSNPSSLSGCDFSESSVRFSCKRFPERSFFVHDLYQPLPAKFDVIFCTEVLEHLDRPFDALQNLVRAARGGGAIVLTVPNGRHDSINEHINFWSPESWKVFIERECPQCSVVTDTICGGMNNIAIIHTGLT